MVLREKRVAGIGRAADVPRVATGLEARRQLLLPRLHLETLHRAAASLVDQAVAVASAPRLVRRVFRLHLQSMQLESTASESFWRLVRVGSAVMNAPCSPNDFENCVVC